MHAFEFLATQGRRGFFVLGSVVLVITGGEALYADMGHFGARPIRVAWYTVVMPGLLLNYFGQGVLLLEHGGDVRNPFFEMAPEWGLYPLVALSTAATIIASQALISGAFSLTQQAVQLGFVPRFTIVHTSRDRARPDLHPAGEPHPDGALRAARPRLRGLERARRRVRHGGDRHDGDHDAAVLRRRARALGLVAVHARAA